MTDDLCGEYKKTQELRRYEEEQSTHNQLRLERGLGERKLQTSNDGEALEGEEGFRDSSQMRKMVRKKQIYKYIRYTYCTH